MPHSVKTPLSHLDHKGRARMVDVSAKPPTRRVAEARCVVRLSPEALAAMTHGGLEKGDAFSVAKIAGIQAAKRTAELIPLAHPLPIEHLDLVFDADREQSTIHVQAQATTTAKTGIELEALVACAISALTLYDMVKAIDPAATVTDLKLMFKRGGTHDLTRRRDGCGLRS